MLVSFFLAVNLCNYRSGFKKSWWQNASEHPCSKIDKPYFMPAKQHQGAGSKKRSKITVYVVMLRFET